MVPISSLRETIVLVIFGVALVPIAAKRAQDAPGYWKAFAANAHHSLAYYDPHPPTTALVLSTSCVDAVSSSRPTNPHTVVGFTRENREKRFSFADSATARGVHLGGSNDRSQRAVDASHPNVQVQSRNPCCHHRGRCGGGGGGREGVDKGSADRGGRSCFAYRDHDLRCQQRALDADLDGHCNHGSCSLHVLLLRSWYWEDPAPRLVRFCFSKKTSTEASRRSTAC